MRKYFFLLLIACTLFGGPVFSQQGRAVWSKEEANEWYATKGWLRGSNFIPSSAVNQLEMWQAATFDSVTIDRELGYAQSIGFNAMRVFLHHVAWMEDPDGFKNRMQSYLTIADKHHIGTIFVIFDDCWNDIYHGGPQPAPKVGIHNSGWLRDPGTIYHTEPLLKDTLEKYVKDILGTFAHDKRILLWDVYNEPGNSGYGNQSLELLANVFSWGREVNPDQPLSSGVWNEKLSDLNKLQLENDDVITYHNYEKEPAHAKVIDSLKKYGRPLICTEYMARLRGSTFATIMPLLKRTDVGAINWGLVSGKTNTIYAWDTPMPDGSEPKIWFHDIFRRDGTPFSVEEVKLIRSLTGYQASKNLTIRWKDPVLINNMPTFKDAGAVKDAVDYYRRQGIYGSQYARLLQLSNGTWLVGYTIARNNGYSKMKGGGLELQFSSSDDRGQHWQAISTISESGRDLDNTEMIQLLDKSVLLACRSVRWQESYILPVYRSVNFGQTWARIGVIDSTAGAPGTLGHPDKGIYEPHFYLLDDATVSVMYANEKHVAEGPSYSQIVSQRISNDNGRSWGDETWVAYLPGHGSSRPGMPVWTRMENGNYIVVYEVCGPEKCDVHYKISNDGTTWPVGLGDMIPDQRGGPFITSLSNGDLLVTSNSGNLSVSTDFGSHWKRMPNIWPATFWGSLYQTGKNEIVALNSPFRSGGGNNIQMKSGEIIQ